MDRDVDPLSCNGIEVEWGEDRLAQEAALFDKINERRSEGRECRGSWYEPTQPLTWHAGLADNLRCAMLRDLAADQELSDWNPTDLAEGTGLVVSLDAVCTNETLGPGCTLVTSAVREDPVLDLFDPDEYDCQWLMAKEWQYAAVGSGPGLRGNAAEWMVALVYPMNQ